jgi:hypothetical protein
MTWKPGISGNTNGRPSGSRNKRNEDIFAMLRNRGDVDPADYLSSILSDKTKDEELRMQAANLLMPYMYSKAGTLERTHWL